MKDFTTGSIPKLLIVFLAPLLLSNVLQAFYILIDAFWAGRLLGSIGVAIVAIGLPVIFLLSSLFIGLVVGASILAGQAFGSHNRQELSHIISSSIIATAALSVSISILGVIFTTHILKSINTPGAIFHGAHVFLSIILVAMVPSCLVQWFTAIMNATGDSRTPFKIILISLILNAFLAPVLITGAGIMPPLGIAGSALSTVIANVVAVMLCFIFWRSHHLSEIAPFHFIVKGDTLRRITAIGLPLSLQMIVVSSSFLFILSQANAFGASVTAAFGIGSRIDQFAFLALFAVTAAISAMTAQNFGAKKFDRIPQIALWGTIISGIIAALFSAAVMIFPDVISGLFTRDPAVIEITRHYFRTVGVGYIALAILFSYQGVLRGA
ncbi:MAG: MATE family efflux transporter, partial [Endomicrobiales bacterium]